MIKGLYVNHRRQQCGVYEFGREIGELLLTSQEFNFSYCECDTLDDLKKIYKKLKPEIIIYNYHPSTMSWVHIKSRWNVPLKSQFQCVQIGMIHEVYQQSADEADNDLFDFHIAADPSLILKNPLVFKTGRLLPQKPKQTLDKNIIPVIGSFGFAMPVKGFEKIITLVQNEFDEAIIKLNIPFAKYGDIDGTMAKEVAEQCRNLIKKDLIKLEISHEFLEKEELLKFLSGNSINVFLYDDQLNRGISSVIDWAIASGRPIAVSSSSLFRHLFHCTPSIVVGFNTFKDILANDIAPIKHLWNEFNSDVILWEYERIVSNALIKIDKRSRNARTIPWFYSKKILKRIGLVKSESNITRNIWTKSEDKFELPNRRKGVVKFQPVDLPPGTPLNRILDNLARVQYKLAIDFFYQYLPRLIAKKIPEANVQQAFVFDTVLRLSDKYAKPVLLAVGSFEDTAVEALRFINYILYDIDPVLNYDLETFITKPGVKAEGYDIIISTSVIEHVENDEQFIKNIAYLLKKGGCAILTCDYKDQYKPGDDIPGVDFRLYTQKDIRERLMAVIPDCSLIDEPQWDCEFPDFYLNDKYNYTFASIVFQKKMTV